jgi:hypothetical protein
VFSEPIAHESRERKPNVSSFSRSLPGAGLRGDAVRRESAPYFERNIGQTDAGVRFVGRQGNNVIFLTATEVVTRTSRMTFAGANADAEVSGVNILPGHSNYFIGKDPKRWRTGVPHFAAVRYSDVYPGIDLLFHARNAELEYDFIVAPGADPSAIRLSFEPAGGLSIDAKGNLVAPDVMHRRPVVYQEIGGERCDVAARYVIDDEGDVRFSVGEYDRAHELTIDPTLVYSTFLGGTEMDVAIGVAVDSSGYAYTTGLTDSIAFPVTPLPGTPLQGTRSGPTDAFVTKINPTGMSIVYSTYLGGSAYDEGLAIAVNATTGQVYLSGSTQSTDFPIGNADGSAPIQSANGGGIDGFVTSLVPSGDALAWSTYLGGSGTDYARGIAVLAGSAHVVGETQSADFPVVLSLQPLLGIEDVFVSRINPNGSALVWSTFLGGTSDENAGGIAVGPLGDVFIAGDTASSDFPVMSLDPLGPVQLTKAGFLDAFVARLRLNLTGTAPYLEQVFGTFLGGSNNDRAFDVDIDSSQNVYVTGYTSSTNFPIFSAAQAMFGGGGYDAFVTKLTPFGSLKLFSTFLGGSTDDFANAVAVTPAGHATVAGHTRSSNFPALNPIQPYAGGTDAFITRFSLAGGSHTYSTHFGGSDFDRVRGVAVRPSFGLTVACGNTNSRNFTVTPGALQELFNGVAPAPDAFVLKFTLYKFAISTSSGFVVLLKQGDYRFRLQGSLLLDRGTNGIDLRRDDVVITLGDYTGAIPGGAFRRIGDYFEFSGPGSGLRLVRIYDDGRYLIDATSVALGTVTFPGQLPFGVEIGDDSSAATIVFDGYGRVQPQ